MPEVLEDLCSIRRGETEVEDAYQKRLNQAELRCGNVHSEDEKIALYINGLSNTIRTEVARYRESAHRRELTFKSLAQFTRSEDEAYRAQLRQIARSQLLQNAASTATRPLHRHQP